MTLHTREGEEQLCDVQFSVHKFTERPRPEDPSKVIIISCFSEFGCEVVGAMYCVPRLIQENPGAYVVVMGWYGRAYLYKHLADEFWEVKEEYQWLRDHALAFHHNSKNLTKIERRVSRYGRVYDSAKLGWIAVGNHCLDCKSLWGQTDQVHTCPKCQSRSLVKSLFSDIPFWRQHAVKIPPPSEEKMATARNLLKPNSVGVFARGRKTYGRNLQPEFYVGLIRLLEAMGYVPVWLGEKQSTQPCPCESVLDLRGEGDLELVLAVVSQLRFTVQFWTASTRLAAITGTPYLIFESPDQLYSDQGQEGYRLALTKSGEGKVALCHYMRVFNDNEGGLALVSRCIREMEVGNFEEVVGLVDEPAVVRQNRARKKYKNMGLEQWT